MNEPKLEDLKVNDLIEETLADNFVRPEQEKHLISLRKMLMLIIGICWLLPITIIFIIMSISYRKGIVQKTEELLKDEVKNFAVTVSYNINEAINTSKNLSYDRQLEEIWRSYEGENMGKAEFHKKASSIIRGKFYHDSGFTNALFYLSDNAEEIYPDNLEERQFYTGDIKKVSNEISNQNTPAAFVKVIDGKIYVIRNLYTTRGYTKFGTLIVALDTEKLFVETYKNDIYKMFFFVDENESLVTNGINLENEHKAMIIQQLTARYQIKENNKVSIISNQFGEFEGYLFQKQYKDYRLGTALIVKTRDVYSELETLTLLILLLILLMVPIAGVAVYFISSQVTKPIDRLVAASKEIRSGNIGVQINGDRKTMPNQEFAYLMLSFNKMSSKIKELFEFAHSEQLARKDAKILALQSQINPHFLNNTLEMMNWQARMVGDIQVSKMIEALSTLLDYSLDRSNKRLIYLSEELRCAEAYCYIISMRFGQRLQVEKEIDESLLQQMVPQLILQPLLENAVMHGVERIKRGVIWLKVYRDENNLILEVRNTGEVLTEEQVERIQRILSGTAVIEDGKGKHVSLGIRNVNERIKLIYGNKFGLTILPVEEGITSAVIVIPIRE